MAKMNWCKAMNHTHGALFGYGCGNNYIRNITFRRAHKNPKYMQILGYLVAHPAGATRLEVLAHTHGINELPSRAWNHGPFAMLNAYGFATYERHGHTCIWKVTQKGDNFYHAMLVEKDLNVA